MISSELENTDLIFASVYPKNAFQSGISRGLYLLFIFSVISMFATPMLVYYYYRQIYVPVTALKTGIGLVRDGDLDYRVPAADGAGQNEFIELTGYFNDMMDEIKETKLRAYELKLQQQELRLSYMSQQIRPHFILNCLNLIYTSGAEKWEYTREMILYLTGYFRYIVNIRKNEVPLVDEMNFLKTYLGIQKLRLGDYFISMVVWDHTLDRAAIPPLSLSTFVENSIKHALSPGERCCIAVNASRCGDRIRILISDSGNGFPEEILLQLNAYPEEGSDGNLGTGIINTIERLRMLYHDEARISFRNENGAVTELDLPFITKEQS